MLTDMFLANRTPALFGNLSDEAWLATILSTLERREVRGVTLPGFPAPEVQQTFVGSSGEHALREGFHFYQVIRQSLEAEGAPLTRESKVLDFGCGWGRILRFFLRDVRADRLHGADVVPEMVSLCAETYGQLARFVLVPPRPPAPLLGGNFDVIYLYSVLSHLNEDTHLAWVGEFAQLLKPGGFLFATTQGRGFLEFCASLRAARSPSNDWERTLSRCFVDAEASRAAYDRGEFLFEPTGGGDHRPSSFYGEAVVPRGFVEARWPASLRLTSFRDDPGFLPQALIVARRV
jgi:SAM-dependent methyltransferase